MDVCEGCVEMAVRRWCRAEEYVQRRQAQGQKVEDGVEGGMNSIGGEVEGERCLRKSIKRIFFFSFFFFVSQETFAKIGTIESY